MGDYFKALAIYLFFISMASIIIKVGIFELTSGKTGNRFIRYVYYNSAEMEKIAFRTGLVSMIFYLIF